MRAYKCDRCGKFFEKYKNQGTAEFLNITRTPLVPNMCLDLCPNCNSELQEWVANDKAQVVCNCTDADIAKSFIEDVGAVEDLLPRAESEDEASDTSTIDNNVSESSRWVSKGGVDCVYDIAGVKTWGVKYQCDRCGFITTVIEDFGHYSYCPSCGRFMRSIEIE